MANNEPFAKETEPLRFAHPFFTDVPIGQRARSSVFGDRLLEHIKGNLQPVPAPTRTPLMTLADVIGSQGAQEINDAGVIRFHSVGDTGRRDDSPQGDVARAMALDFDVSKPAESPAFFLHLGDVIYGTNKDQRYRQEFYEPYVHYPGKIIAIPGNHDGEVIPKTDPQTLQAFLANFCAPSQVVPPIAGTIFRQTMNQPGVYWMLDAPFLQILGLYSNAAENPGFISGTIPGQSQKNWLVGCLKNIRTQRQAGRRKALVVATHHPPFTAGGHSPSTLMIADIDDAFKQGGVEPDLFLSGHAHSYQRYTRRVSFGGHTLQTPYIVAGCGGINDQAVPTGSGQVTGDHTFEKSLKGYGYLLIEVTAQTLKVTMKEVNGQAVSLFDQVTINLS